MAPWVSALEARMWRWNATIVPRIKKLVGTQPTCSAERFGRDDMTLNSSDRHFFATLLQAVTSVASVFNTIWIGPGVHSMYFPMYVVKAVFKK